jgi:hypothetical protein
MGGAGRSEESPLHPAIAIAIAIAVAHNPVIRNLLIHAII